MFGFRPDGRRVSSIDPIVGITPYLMPMRCDAQVFLQHRVDYELLTGHWENLNPFSVEYLRHMLILVKGVIRGDIPIGYYTRKPGRWAGYLDANIFYPYAVFSYENEK